MKKYILFAFLLAFVQVGVFAQQKVVVKDAQGKIVFSDYVWKLSDITFDYEMPDFSNSAPAPSVEGEETDVVDLGICNHLKWSKWNFGATNEFEKGLLIGWADTTANVKSEDLKYYPAALPPYSIVRGEYDIVARNWEDKWRMPKESELQALISDCDWKYVTEYDAAQNPIAGWRISGRGEYAKNSIFLPVTGKRIGESEEEGESSAYYWSGVLDESDTEMAFCLSAEALETAETAPLVKALARYIGAAIRPVYGNGEYDVNLEVTYKNVTAHTVDLRIMAKGSGTDLADVTEYGFKYIAVTPEDSTTVTLVENVGQADECGNVDYTLEGLSENTKYKYLGYAIIYGDTIESDTMTFVTKKPDLEIKPLVVSDVTKNSYKVTMEVTGDYAEGSAYKLVIYTDSLNTDPEKLDMLELRGSGTATKEFKNLPFNTRYYLQLTCVLKGVQKLSKVLLVTTEPNMPVADAVDMGTGVLWSTFNIGASKVGERGGYFNWGDPTSDPTGATGNGPAPDSMLGAGKSIVGTEYDIANVQWKYGWVMPTKEDFEALIANCEDSRPLVYFDGVPNIKLTSKTTKNVIYIPYGGYYDIYGKLQDVSTETLFWMGDSSPYNPYTLWFRPLQQVFEPNRSPLHRINIRPVYKGDPSIGIDTSDKDDPSQGGGGSTDPDEPGVDPEPEPEPETELAGKAVDLGLSVKWADYNVGATNYNPVGEYYAWGAVEPNANKDYSLETYCFYEGESVLSKPGLVSISGTDYDVARKLWGGTWRIPSRNELDELLIDCSWEWVDATDAIPTGGYKVVSKINGNSIFIPAGGRYSSTALLGEGTSVWLWSSTLDTYNATSSHTKNKEYSYYLQFSSDSGSTGGVYRTRGMNIRPVCNY